MNNMPFYAKTYSLITELNKYNFLNKNKIFTNNDCLKLRSILKKDLDITMSKLTEDRKMDVLNSMNFSMFGKCKKNN